MHILALTAPSTTISQADDQKIEDGEKWLLQKQQLELQQRMNQHQALPNSGMVDWGAIAAQLQQRHNYQRQQFDEKKSEVSVVRPNRGLL